MLHENLIQVQDQTAMGETTSKLTVSFKNPTVRVRDIIAQRIQTEVDSHNKKGADAFFSLVKPADAEETPNGYKARHHVDAAKQIAVALEAFKNDGFFVLVGDHQVIELDLEVQISENPEISFIKLKDLVGG